MSEQIPVHKLIKSISFGLCSPKMIKRISSVKVVTPELYDREGYPVDGGLMDIRLGVIDPGLKCKTCGSKLKECLGHFGHIELARPVVHINYAKIIYDLLKATCKDCGRALVNKEESDTNEIVDMKNSVGLKIRSKYIKLDLRINLAGYKINKYR